MNKGMAPLHIALTTLFLCLLIMVAGCQKSNDAPPDPGTPEPLPLEGVFSSDYGTLTFDGDGKTVHVSLTPEYLIILDNPPNNDDYEYVFCWYSFGSCRYDVATELYLYHLQSDTSITFSLGINTSENRITIAYPVPKDGFVIFAK